MEKIYERLKLDFKKEFKSLAESEKCLKKIKNMIHPDLDEIVSSSSIFRQSFPGPI